MQEHLIHIDLIPHLAYCKLIGKGDQYVKGKIKDGKWTEGRQYFKDPDGQIWVSVNGVAEWVKQNTRQVSALSDLVSKYGSHGTNKGTNPSGRSRQTPKTSKPQSVFALT